VEETLSEQLKRMLQKADRTFKAAKDLLEMDYFESASSRAYYSVFYLLEAVLLVKGLCFSKHSAVIAAFSKYFIKEGIFPKDFAKKIRALRKDREIGDYGYYDIIAEDKAREDVAIAEELLSAFKEYLYQKADVKNED
jgi:uncharacterized protein (UPF0332 family)